MKLDNFFNIDTEFNFDKEKELFIENLDMLKSMSVQEQTLYKKWLEFNNNEKTRQNLLKIILNQKFSTTTYGNQRISTIKNKQSKKLRIWTRLLNWLKHLKLGLY